jgi:hypothetical protein
MRLPDWQDRLTPIVYERLTWPHEWGKHDCALWAAVCREAVTGENFYAPYLGTYRSAAGALRRLRAVDGVASPVELADLKLGERLHPAMAKVGDVVAADLWALGIADDDEPRMGPSLGVCYGHHSLFVGTAKGHDGLVRVLTGQVDHCYG